MRVVAALGGNALSPAKGTGSVEELRTALAPTAAVLADLVVRGVSLVLTHGNGPQVGRILLQQEAGQQLSPPVPPMPMDVCGAESQGQLGYLLAQAIDNALAERGAGARAVCLLTQVVVDGRDPAFRRPTKPVGPTHDGVQARSIAAASGHVYADQGADRWRRVVPSPDPMRLVEQEPLLALVGLGQVVVAAGGGGVPVVDVAGRLHGVEAVVDKDRTAAMLADAVSADLLLVLTEVPRVSVGFGTPDARPLARLGVREARALLAAGEFPDGSMGPKVRACADFVAGGGPRAVIAALADCEGAVFGDAGTTFLPD